MTPDLDLAALKAVAEAATPGRWEVDDSDPSEPIKVRTPYDVDVNGDTGQHIIVGGRTLATIDDGRDEDANARHIATFDPSTILALIARIEAQDARIAELDEALEFYAGLGECPHSEGKAPVCIWDDGDCARAALGDSK